MIKIIISFLLSLFLLVSCNTKNNDKTDEFYINSVNLKEDKYIKDGNNEGEKMNISFNGDNVDIEYSIDKNINNIHTILYEAKPLLYFYKHLDDNNFDIDGKRVYLKCDFSYEYQCNNEVIKKEVNRGYICDMKNSIKFTINLNDTKDITNLKIKISLHGKPFNRDNFQIIYHNNKGE